MLGAIDAVSPCLMLAAWQIYSLALLKDYKSQYPLGTYSIISNDDQIIQFTRFYSTPTMVELL